MYMIYQIATYSATMISRSHHYLMLNISETVPDRHSFNGILIGTYTHSNQQCYFE